MTRIRVARIITRLNVGGPAIQAMLLTERLDPTRYESVLICGRPEAHEGDMAQFRPSPGVRPIVVPGLRREISPIADLRSFVQIVRILRRFRPHIVHTHMAKAGLLGRLAARLAGSPVVLHTFHGNVLRGYFGSPMTRVFILLERALARLSTRLIAISGGQGAELEDLGIASRRRIVEIPLGVDLVPFLATRRGAFRAELGVSDDVPLVGIVARLVPIKAVHVFLEAAARLRVDHPTVMFVVVGDGVLRPWLEELARSLGLGLQVRFTGWRADLPAIYADLDVMALTSRNEGTPVSAIEALASGCAVVATAVGGVPDIVRDGHTGLLARSGDAGDVARRISELLRDADRRRALGAAGRAAVFPEHDITTLIARVDALYSRLLADLDMNQSRRLDDVSGSRS